MTFEQLLDSKEFIINLGRMIERLSQATSKGASWLDISEDGTTYTLEDGNQVSIELVPAWATLENVDASRHVDLYNTYNDSSYTPKQFAAGLGSAPYKDMDVKVRLLDYYTGLDSTIQVYFFDEHGELQNLF